MERVIYVVEYVAQDGSEQGVSGAFSSWFKANDYILSRFKDAETAEAIGEYEYIITKVILDSEV